MRNLYKSLRLWFIVGFLVLSTTVAQSSQVVQSQSIFQTWYVDQHCVTCGDGTLDSPFRNILVAINYASEGDTILVAQGIYVDHLYINTSLRLMGGYTATLPTWTRDITEYETVIVNDEIGVRGDWNGDWLGSLSVVKGTGVYRMWYSGGSEIDGDRIGYADSPDGVNWFHPLVTPLLEPGAPGSWDEAGVANPFVLTTEDGFGMWYVGWDLVGNRAIGYAMSTDGLTWQKYEVNPVLRPDVADATGFGFPTVIRVSYDTYIMWYSGDGRIWGAASQDGLSWIKNLSAPVLPRGSSGAWDDAQVYAPRVLASPTGGYEMWYIGYGSASPEPSIGYAWSEDGLTWTKSLSNPVLSGMSSSWEEEVVGYPAVVREGPDDYRMWYIGGIASEQAIGLASSDDGMTWNKYGANPILRGGQYTEWGRSTVTIADQSSDTVLDGFTITGGVSTSGAGIYMIGPHTTIRNCKVTGNIALSSGGGMNIAAGAPLIENTVVSDNRTVAGWAGGIFIGQASPTISGSLVMSNVAKTSGGGVVAWGALESTALVATSIMNNVASKGGGLSIGSFSDLKIYDSVIRTNTAAEKAGLRVENSTLAMTNTFVVGNRATSGASGAMDFWQSTGRLVNVTVADNSASEGAGGITFYASEPSVNLVALNSIMAFNGLDDLACSEGSCSVSYSDVQEGFTGVGNISADPRFVDRNHGDYHLRGSSPVIDAGTSTGAPAVDFEGDPRPAGAVDMGADEYTGGPVEDKFVFLPLVLRSS